MNLYSRKVFRWTATISLFVLVSGCSASDLIPGTSPKNEASPAANKEQNTNSKSSEKSVPKDTRNIGETVAIKDKNLNLTFRVNGTREHSGKRVLKPNKGNKWVLVDTTIVNQGQKPTILPVVAFKVVDNANKEYEVALLAGALDDVKSPTGEIKPGGEKRGEVAFEVPEKAKGLKLVFNPNINDCKALDAAKSKQSSTPSCTPTWISLN
jgi:hypothetical protein